MRKLGLIALLTMLCISGAAFAQTTMPVFCGDLSATDCTILTNSQTASKSLDSASFNLTVNTTITNGPEMQEPVTIGVTGSGSYSGIAALHAGDMTMMQTDPGAFISSVLQNFDGDLTLTVNLPPEVVAQAGAGTPNSLTLQLRLVDGFGYINFDTLKPLMSEMGSGMNFSGWGGLDLASLLKAALQQMPDMFNNMSGMNGMTNGADMSALMQQFSDPAFMSKFVTITRTDTGTGDTATFETSVNLAALMAQPEFQDMMRQQMAAQGQTMQQQDMDQMMSMMTMMYQNMTVTVTEEIGLSDSFVHSIHGVVNFDTSAMMTSMASMADVTPTPGAAEPAPVVNIDFTLTYADFNSVAPITAPPNAAILPWQSLLGTDMTTPEATAEMMTPTMTATTGDAPATAEPTMEMTMEPTSEMTAEPTSEVTDESTVVVPTLEPTVEVTAGS